MVSVVDQFSSHAISHLRFWGLEHETTYCFKVPGFIIIQGDLHSANYINHDTRAVRTILNTKLHVQLKRNVTKLSPLDIDITDLIVFKMRDIVTREEKGSGTFFWSSPSP